MQIKIKSNNAASLNDRYMIFGSMIDDVELDSKGNPMGFTGLNLTSKTMEDDSIVFDIPKTEFGGKHALFVVSCVSQFGAIRALKIGNNWSMVVASTAQNPTGHVKFPEDSPKMDVAVSGGEVLINAFVDPATDEDVCGRGVLRQVAAEYMRLKEIGVIAKIERGEEVGSLKLSQSSSEPIGMDR